MENEQEKAAEQAALVVAKEEEVRSKIITEFEFDEEADKTKIDKLVAKEMEHQTKLSSAIGQKIKHRKEADELRKAGATVPPKNSEVKVDGDLSAKDAMVLMNAKVTEEEDINEVVEYAKFKKISIADALKASVVKTSLAEKAEFRKTAEATNTSAGRRGSSKPSGEALLDKASDGQVPEESDDEGIEKLAAARQDQKKARNSKK